MSALGARWAFWTQERIIDAMRTWERKHGLPPRFEDWRNASPWHPASSTVQRAFGTWNNAVTAAGFEARPVGAPAARWTRQSVIEAIFNHVYNDKKNRLPTQLEWTPPSADRPSARQVIRLFGSWNGAIVAAGYEPVKLYRADDSPHSLRARMAHVTKAEAA